METFHHTAAAALVSCEATLLFSRSRFSLCRVEWSKCSPLKVMQSQLVLAVFPSDQPQQTWRLLMTDAALTDGATVICVCFGVCLMWKYLTGIWCCATKMERRGDERTGEEGWGDNREGKRRGRKENRVQECFFSINRLSGISSTFSSCGFREKI